MLEQASARLVALRLPERARVVARPDGERVPGELRRLDRVDATPTGEQQSDLAGQDARAELERARALYEREGNLVMAKRTRSRLAKLTASG